MYPERERTEVQRDKRVRWRNNDKQGGRSESLVIRCDGEWRQVNIGFVVDPGPGSRSRPGG